MKRILLITSLLSFAAQAPMHAVESKLLAWAQDDVTKAMVKEGVSSLKTDAKVLASASWNMLKSAYEALPSKQTILKNASKLIEKNPKAVAGGLIFAAIAAPTIAAVRAESNDEKNKTQEQKQLEQLQLSLNFIEKHLREFNGLEELDPETQRLQNQEQLRIFIDRLKIAIVKFIPEGEINKNLKSRMEELSTVINDDIAIINVENKRFETAYINLKAAVRQTTQAFSSYYDWFVTLQSDVKVLDAYLLRMRQPSAPKIETQASVQAEMQRQLSHRFIVNSLKGVNVQELTLKDLDPALGFTELSQGINQLKAVVADSNNIHYKNAELTKLRHSLQWVVTSRLAKIDKSTVATSFFKTGFLVTLPLMASAIIIAEKYL